MNSVYWQRLTGDGRVSRRRFTGGATMVGLAAAAAGIVGCSSSKNNNAAGKAATAAPATAASAATSAGGTRAATPAAAAAGSPAAASIDSTKGKPGGTLKYMQSGYPARFTILDQRSAYKFCDYTNSGLLAQHWGTQGVAYNDYSLEPDLAQAMPEQPDPTTYVYKLRQAKFSTGRAVTSQDVQYSYDRQTNLQASVYASEWQSWYDHTETPDAQTVVVKTKGPFADAVEATSANSEGFILLKEWEEGPDVATKTVGSGPYVFGDTQTGVSYSYKRNPDYYLKPYPYFDQITELYTPDIVARKTNFITRQVDMPWIVYPDDRDDIKKQRPDARLEEVKPYSGNGIFMRTDKAPFNDARVRQALSMLLDRTAIMKAVNKGEGDLDQFFTIMYQKQFGTSAVKDLGAPAKYWNLDPQSAKQLLSAAGVTLPFDSTMSHQDGTAIGQQFPDTATLIEAQWKQANVANVKDNPQNNAVFGTTTYLGNYDGLGLAIQSGPISGLGRGLQVKNLLYTGPTGEHSAANLGYVNDPDLNTLAVKQLGQLNVQERQQTFRQMEQIIALQQYWITLNSESQSWFFDPSVTDAMMAQDQGSRRYAMKWWRG